MARVTYSPLIAEMSGKTGDAVFSRWKGIDYVRSRVTPANPQSAAQTLQRNALANTLTLWQSVKAWAQDVWNTYATGYAKSGYNRYMEDNILLVKAGTAGSLTPYAADYQMISAADAAAGAAGVITVTWTNDSGISLTDYVHTFYRKTESGSEEYEWTHNAAADVTDETDDITGLDTGEEYEVAVFCADSDTLLSITEAQESYNEVLDAG